MCEAKFGWDENANCYAGAPSSVVISTPAPASTIISTTPATPSIMVRSFSPSVTLSSWPSAHTTTDKPTPRHTTTKHTYKPTLKHKPQPIVAPSCGPSSSPTPEPTDGPTISTTRQKEQLLSDLKAISPLSSDSLDDERSDQYRVMEWLVDNANHATYSNERKVK
mmetsp:Transcript_25846/g.47513  ORF Transcript_25846/g.47513 Transcript_25846/m.47513 type:complete len:165 (-) Transcript_25846:216-710(-)